MFVKLKAFIKQHYLFLAGLFFIFVIFISVRSMWWYNPTDIPKGHFVCLRDLDDNQVYDILAGFYGYDSLMDWGRYYDDGLFVGYWVKVNDYTGSASNFDILYLGLDFREYEGFLPSIAYYSTISPPHMSIFDRCLGWLLGGGICVDEDWARYNLDGYFSSDLGW